jgi:hypothetical protein
MKFNTGFFDGLFGKKTTLQVPQDDGTSREVTATESWLKKMKDEGKIVRSENPPDTVIFHVIGLDGPETRHLRVGTDIPFAQYQKLKDPRTGALYGLTVYENGAPKTTIIGKEIWGQAETQFREIDRDGEESMKLAMKMLKNL